jgi:hypothetical protein
MESAFNEVVARNHGNLKTIIPIPNSVHHPQPNAA